MTMIEHPQYRHYPLVDTTVGTRLILGFSVAEEAVRRRVQQPFEPHPAAPPAYLAAAGSLGANTDTSQQGPNLLLVFNDLLLNQDSHGRTQADAAARYVGFNIPSRNTVTAEQGMVHFRIFTGNPNAVPGRYRDSLPAQVRRQFRTIGEGLSTTVEDHWELIPEGGGTIDLQVTYERGPLTRIIGEEPDFPVWAAANPRILRIYQEDALFELIRLDSVGIDRTKPINLRITVPELSDLFSGDEKLLSIFGNPHYSRRVFSPPAREDEFRGLSTEPRKR